MKRKIWLAVLLTLCLSLLAASPTGATEQDDGDSTDTGDSAEASVTIELSETAITLDRDATTELTAITSAPAEDVVWTIANEKIVTKGTPDGYTITLKGAGAGETDVMARVGDDAVATCVVTVSGLVIAPSVVDLGEEEFVELSVTGFGAAKDVNPADCTWSSNPEGVVTVEGTETGATARAVAVGNATITCSDGQYSASCPATVSSKGPIEVTLSESELTVSAGGSVSVQATTTASADKITWKILDTAVAAVDSTDGYAVTVKGVATGQTTLTAQVGTGPVARCTVMVSGVAFSSESVSVETNASIDLTLLTYGDARELPVSSWEWTSSATDKATVTASGTGAVVQGVSKGNATITVTVGDYTASCLVTVTASENNAGVSLSESTITMAPGTTSRLRATTTADSADIVWDILNTNIAEIASKTGYTIILAAGDPGQTTITARVGNAPATSCSIIVSGVTLSTNSIAMVVNGSDNITLTTYGEAQNVPHSNWEWSSSNTGVAIVVQTTSGATVRAVGAGNSTITCTGGGYTVMCQVSVSANEASAIETKLSGGILKFTEVLPNLKSVCKTMTQEDLSYITNVSVNTRLGTLYDGYVSEGDTGFGVATTRNYYATSGAYLISNITFVPKTDVNGTVRISYDGFTVTNKTFTGSILVTVSQEEATLAYASLNGAVIHFRAEDFFNYSMAVNNRSLQFLTFTLPPARYGTLYYNYVNASVYESVVSGGTRYYRTYNPGISNVAFVPNATYSGNFSLAFTGYDTEGVSFSGVVRISVTNPNGSDDDGGIRERLHYETGPGSRVYLVAQDFIDECKVRTGYGLVSIRFKEFPDTDCGRFYYAKGDRLYTGTEYGVSELNKLNFVAHKKYTGSFTVPFTGETDRETTFTGTIYVTVSSDGAYLIYMSATGGVRAYLSATDFSDITRTVLGNDFHHVNFPSAPAMGDLYYEGGTSPVPKTTFYYRTGSSALLSSVNYIAPDTFSGTVRIPYAVWDTEGNSFNGHLAVVVKSPGEGAGNGAGLYATSGPALALRASDILKPAQEEIGDVTSVHLTPPSPSVGKLLLNYLSPGQYAAFDSSKDYTPDTLGQIYFLPKAGYSGEAAITYVARNRYNVVYSGILRVQVKPPEASAYFSDLYNRAWAVPAVDFFRYYGILNGVTSTTYEPDGPARRGAFIAVMGRMYGFPNYPGNGGYEDVNAELYYAPYISAARALGVTEAAQYFYPDAAISRQDAAVYLYRCLVRSGHAPNAPVENLSRFKDGYLVSYYAMEAMSGLVELGVFQGDEYGYLNPAATLTRLQMAAILYRAVT